LSVLRSRKAWKSVLWLALMVSASCTSAFAFYLPPTLGAMSSPFGWRVDPFTGRQRFHGGIDIAASEGSPVYATQAGLVTFSGVYGGYGNVVVLNHGNTLYTLYGHNSRLLVQVGQPVYRGQIIALVGSTGRSTGPHLHFEVHYKQQYVNPLTYLSYLQQSPTMATARPVLHQVPNAADSAASASKTTKASTVAAAKKPPAQKSKSSRRTYNATVQLINGTKIQNVRL
jgi:hypothetical protein